MIKAGYTPEEILERLDKIRATIDELFVVDDLKNLSRGGRLSNASISCSVKTLVLSVTNAIFMLLTLSYFLIV